MEQGLKDIKEKLDTHCLEQRQDKVEQKEDFKNFKTEMKGLVSELGHNKANKWVEKFVYAIISGGALYFIYELIRLLEK